jgi:hypothetical protein
MTSFEELILVFYIWILITLVEVTMKSNCNKQHCAIISRRLIKKLWFEDTGSFFLSTLPYLHQNMLTKSHNVEAKKIKR